MNWMNEYNRWIKWMNKWVNRMDKYNGWIEWKIEQMNKKNEYYGLIEWMNKMNGSIIFAIILLP